MRLKALLGLTALLLLTACTVDPTGPSTSRTTTEQRADGGGNGQFGSGG
jgi:outer membrane biogenesis lipoprotein LolB